MHVLALAMFVSMYVDLFGGEQFSQCVNAEKYEHRANDGFELCFDRVGDLKLKKDDDRADNEKRDRMSNSPHSADKRCCPQILFLADDRRDCRQMISLDRMLQPEQKADQEH
jgi:hypothetical protein